jgi:3-oxoadipate enol-lactonase
MPSLILLHGLGIGHRMWLPQIEALEDRFHIIAPDLSGFAKSASCGPFTLARAAADVAQLIDEHLGSSAHVCGLSLGAMVALEIAVNRPASVQRLVVSGAQVRPHRALVTVQTLVMGLVPSGRLVSSIAKSIPGERSELKSAAREDLSQTGKHGLLDAINEGGRADFRMTMSRIQSPTVVLCGGRDRVNIGAARLLATTVPNATLKIIPDVGHVWNLESPDLFTRTLDEFLTSS